MRSILRMVLFAFSNPVTKVPLFKMRQFATMIGQLVHVATWALIVKNKVCFYVIYSQYQTPRTNTNVRLHCWEALGGGGVGELFTGRCAGQDIYN